MTTIAYDGKILAVDSRITSDSYITTDSFNKIYKLTESQYYNDILLYVALSGEVSQFKAYANILETPYFYDLEDSHDITDRIAGIVIGKYSIYTIEKGTLSLAEFSKNTKLSEGSGAKFALSAMALGLNAIDAVKHAIKFDVFSGGKVNYIKL